jgi:hypothetical protein
MLQEKVLRENRVQSNILAVRRPSTAPRLLPDQTQQVHITEMLRVLDRAAEDDTFIAQLTYHGDRALEAYGLTRQEKAAILSGDIAWIEARLGKLDARLRTWLDCRLQQERW